MDEKLEKIGHVILDYTDYPGEDFYSEGADEDALLDIVREHTPDEYNHIIAASRRWSVLYHLSNLRGNIVDFLPIEKNHTVLEIGAGCGAVTGALSEKAGFVTCVELSRKRSLINAYRHQDRENIAILVGNFQDIYERLNHKFDYIMLIGVLEYAAAYIDGDKPYERMLAMLSELLDKGGRIVIAIENKYGMKYFAGCREDHSGRYFDGIEGYPEGGPAKTFSKAELTRLAKRGQFDYTFYYPYPDYKLPISIYSDERLPSQGDFTENDRNFDGERLKLFDEGLAFDEAVRDGYFPFFSNSYLLVLERERRRSNLLSRKPVFSKHSNERDPLYQIRTDIEVSEDGSMVVVKYPLTGEAVDHLENMAEAYEKLKTEFNGSSFRPNLCHRVEDEDGNFKCLEFEYIKGQTMSEALDKMRQEGRIDGCLDAISNFADALRKTANRNFHVTDDFIDVFAVDKVPGQQRSMRFTDLDFVFTNLIFHKGWNVIDYEWTFGFPIPVDFIIYRAIFYYLSSAGCNAFPGVDLYEMLGISVEQKQVFQKMEMAFQQFIAGRHLSLVLLYSLFGGNNIRLDNTLRLSRLLGRPEHPKLYYNFGDGYFEDNTCILDADRDEEDHISFQIMIPEGCSSVRFDPLDVPCVLRMDTIQIDGENIKCYYTNGTLISDNIILFDTDDPQILIEDLPLRAILHLEYDIACMDEKFWKPITFEFDVPKEDEGTRWSHFIHGSRPVFIKVVPK
ncbi:MAG: class I SAM-dependent methyltransferase [Lachnospiraceae bacterium]|nr:class I SAM-dependent methyltransferase [Lachnospiraceae bacterium]